MSIGRIHSACRKASWGSTFRISVGIDVVRDFVVVNVCTSSHPLFRGIGRFE